MIKGCKSQTAMEFLILTGIVLFFFTVFFLAIGDTISDKTRENIDKIITDIAISIQEEISFASESKDGYYRLFTIPEDINGLDYDIQLVDGFVYLKTDNNKYTIALPVSNVTGNLNKGQNIIKKQGGNVYLNS